MKGVPDVPVRIGIVGAGTNTRLKHIPALQKIPGVEIGIVCNRSEESSRRVAGEFHIPRIARHWKEVVSDPEVDAVVIGTWPSLHAEVTIAALEHCKHVLTEARMASTLHEAWQMHRASRQHPDLIAQIVPAPMSLEVDDVVRGILRRGELGNLREVIVIHTAGPYAEATAPLTWRQDEALSGVNTLSLGIMHEIVQRWIDEEPLWVIAEAGLFTTHRFDPRTGREREVKIPDSVNVIGRFPSGAQLLYRLSGVEAGPERGEIHLNGSRACLRFDFISGRLVRTDCPESHESLVTIPPEERRGWRVEEDFIHSIRTGSPVYLTNFEQGMRYMRFVQAVWDSHQRNGRRIRL